jgi:hypothetical protein
MGKYWQHFKYTSRHKFYVAKYCFEVGLYWRGIMHDMSKFRLCEFIPYACYFFEPYISGERKAEKKHAFNMAWLKHQNRNDHHWHYFVSVDYEGQLKFLDMPHDCVVEMICDWRAAGKAKGTSDGSWQGVSNYYNTNKERMLLSNNTRFLVEQIIQDNGG